MKPTDKKDRKEVGILAVGNLIYGDDGFGIHVLRYLQDNFRFPDKVELLDGGTAGLMLEPFFKRIQRAIVIDVVRLADRPGSIHIFSEEDLSARVIQTRMSPHQIGVLEVLQICRLTESIPEHVYFVCAVPKRIDLGTELSPELAQAVPNAAAKVLEFLDETDIKIDTNA